MPSSPAADPRDGACTAHLVVAAVLSVLLCAAISVVDFIPTNDGPNTIVNGYLALHLHDAGKGYDRFLVRNANVTSNGFDVPFVLLSRVLPWREALGVTLCLGALLWAWAFVALLAAIDRRRLPLLGLGFATALSWPFYMGFYSYWLATGAALAVLALGVSWRTWSAARLFALGALVLAVAYAHNFAAFLLGIALAALAAARTTGRERAKALLGLALAGAPSVALSVLAAVGISGKSLESRPGIDPFAATWLGAAELLRFPADCFAGGPLWRSALPPLAALLGLGFLVLRARKKQASSTELGLSLFAALTLVLSFALPLSFEVWQFFSPRFLPAWVLIGSGLVPVERAPRALQRGIAFATASFAVAAVAWSALHHVALAEHEKDALALISAPVKRSGTRLPLKLTAPLAGIAYGDSGTNLPLLYTIEQGGMVPDLFATASGLHPHLYRDAREKLFPRFPGRFYGELFRSAGKQPKSPPKPVQLTWIALLGSAYDDVILISEPSDADTFIARGYEVDARQGKAAIVRYRGCGLRVQIETQGPTDAPVVVEYGWTPVLQPADGSRIAKGKSGPLRVDFPRAPCGDVWVRVTWDNDQSGGPSGADTHCAGADPLGLLKATLSPSEQVVTCRAPTPTPAPAP